MIYDAHGRKLRHKIGFKSTPVDAIACSYVDIEAADEEAKRSIPEEE